MKTLLLSTSILLLTGALHAAEPTTFWVQPCSVKIPGCKAGDADLLRWALAAWEKASSGHMHYVETKNEDDALLRVLWADKSSGLYGEAIPIRLVDGRRGSILHILVPEPGSIQDPLLRETIVYLTCLHESGHALGLAHTREFADIMYSFQYGGDIDEYFGRYRRKLAKREDIRENPGMSAQDIDALVDALALQRK